MLSNRIRFCSSIDEYGFERPNDFDYETYEEFMSNYLRILAKRSKKWTELMANKSAIKRSLTLKRYIRKGIPKEHRCIVSILIYAFVFANYILNDKKILNLFFPHLKVFMGNEISL